MLKYKKIQFTKIIKQINREAASIKTSQNNTVHISIVTPVYGCCESLKSLYNRLTKTLSGITEDFEIILVNDGSPDNAWPTIISLSQKDSRVKGINLSRNFGQHRAIAAGLHYTKGDWIIVMDCDLQDQPEEISKLYQKAQEGYDVVVGRRVERQDSLIKRLSSYLFYKVYNYLTDSTVDKAIGNFGIYSKQVIENVNRFHEQNRSFGLFVLWSGFSRIEIDLNHAKREIGKTSYTFNKLVSLAIDSIIAHSNKPLKLSVKFGFSLSIISMVYSLWLVVDYLIWAKPVAGWTSLMVSLYFLTGLIIGSIGMVGLYIGKIFDEVKHRPLYMIKDMTFVENTDE